MDQPLDVVIVGAGLAGLAAASTLHGLRVRILEREAHPGGRVFSVSAGDLRVDLGACFAYNPALLPGGVAMPSVLYRERGPIGLFMFGQLVSGDTASAVMLRAGNLGLPETEGARAFFRQIHPADMTEYSRARQGDAWHDWFPDHWLEGNASLVDAYTSRLNEPVSINTEVTDIHEQSDVVSITYKHNNAVLQLQTRALIVATPATTASKLVAPRDPACAAFLGSVKYGRYTVVALNHSSGQSKEHAALRCVVAPHSRLSLVIQQHFPDRGARTLLCYYAEQAASYADALTDEQLIAATKQDLIDLGVAASDLENATGWVKRWPLSGTVLSDTYAEQKRADFSRATRRIFLAGDYLAMTPDWGYGMDDAVTSGRTTGALVRAALESEL